MHTDSEPRVAPCYTPCRAGPGRAQLLDSLVDSESEAPTQSLESDDPTQSAARMSRWHCHGASRRRVGVTVTPGHVDVRVTGTGTGVLAINLPRNLINR